MGARLPKLTGQLRAFFAVTACMCAAFALTAAPAFARDCDPGGAGRDNHFEWSGKIVALVAGLDDERASERRATVRCLTNVPGMQAEPHLMRALQDPDLDVQLEAIAALARIGARSAAPALVALANDRRSEVRVATIQALAALGMREEVSRIVTALADPSGDVRRAAVRAIGALRSPEAIAPLTAALDDDNKDVVVDALEELASFADRTTVYATLEKTRDPAVKVKVAAIQALGTLRDPRATPALVALVRSPSGEVSRAALRAIARTGDREAVDPLHAMLTESVGADTLFSIVRTLGALGDVRSAQPLLGLLRNELFATPAANALSQLGPQVVPVILDELARAEEPAYQAQLLRVLADVPSAEAAQTLEIALATRRFPRDAVVMAISGIHSHIMLEALVPIIPELPERDLATVIARILPIADDRVIAPFADRYAELGKPSRLAILALFAAAPDKAALPVVREELGAQDPELRRAAIFAAHALADPSLLSPLAHAMRSDDQVLRRQAALALAAIGGEDVVEVLLEVAQDKTHPGRVEATWALAFASYGVDVPDVTEFALEVLEAPGHPAEYAALDIIATTRPEELATWLPVWFERGRTGVQRKVVEIAGMGRVAQAAPLVLAALDADEPVIRTEAAWAAARIGDQQAVERLLAMADLPAAPEAVAAIRSLGALGVTQAIPLLTRRLYDRDPFVACNALWALVELDASPSVDDLEVLLYRARNPFLQAMLARALLRLDADHVIQAALQRESDPLLRAAMAQRLSGEHDVSGSDRWLVLDVSEREVVVGEDGRFVPRPAIAEEVYLLLPDGSVKATYSDENGKVRVELDAPGEIRVLFGAKHHIPFGNGLLP